MASSAHAPDAGDPARQGADRQGRQRDVFSLDEAPQGCKDFDSGVAKKFVLNPHG